MRTIVALVLVLATGPAAAHVAPAIGDNNRYLKLTPLGDRIRLSYTVLYGAVPSAGIRRAIDVDQDGTIGDAERRAFGVRVARNVALAIELTIDGARQPVEWSAIDVGLGAQAAASAEDPVSLDLVAWICLASPRGKHAVLLRDDYHLDRPGETEVKVEDAPAVTIDATRIDGAEDDTNDYNLVGPSGALATDGLELRFTAGERAPVTPDVMCPGPPRSLALPSGVIAGAIGGTAIAAGASIVVILRIRRRRRRGQAGPRGAGGPETG